MPGATPKLFACDRTLEEGIDCCNIGFGLELGQEDFGFSVDILRARDSLKILLFIGLG
jgi:hypothetical protein